MNVSCDKCKKELDYYHSLPYCPRCDRRMRMYQEVDDGSIVTIYECPVHAALEPVMRNFCSGCGNEIILPGQVRHIPTSYLEALNDIKPYEKEFMEEYGCALDRVNSTFYHGSTVMEYLITFTNHVPDQFFEDWKKIKFNIKGQKVHWDSDEQFIVFRAEVYSLDH